NLHGEGAAKYRDQHAQRSASVPPGLKHKDVIGIPWMLAFALRADGWYLRQDIIWHKPNPMPESVRDRCTKAHEYVFLLSKSDRYFFDSEAMQEPATYAECGRPSRTKGSFLPKGEPLPGQLPFRSIRDTRNRRSVWTVATQPYRGAHFATFPPALIEPCILAGSRTGDVVLDPFMGSGTTAAVAIQHDRQYIGCELNPDYESLQQRRIWEAVNSRQSDLLSDIPA
ncbi:MAG TPA: site-specific DNA-methyltransferase, partial [Steroidobacteraceae bacterium]|nr:site-specific DNA-methyltransferase [Steroidobacteraceae bacterium]